MEWFNADICALESPLYQTPEVLKAIRMNFSDDVSFSMVNDLVNVVRVQSTIAVAIICRKMRAALDVIFYQRMKRRTFAVRENLGSNFSVTLQHAANYNFVGHALSKASCAGFGSAVSVHKAGLTADESLIYFDVPAEFSRVR